MKEPLFLTLAEVLEIHEDQIAHYGGILGVRDLGLLQSALAQPEASFSGKWLHEGLFRMAAAYAFHICRNHPFPDGNKRTALTSALVFLEMNSVSINDPQEELLKAMLKLAEGKLTKQEFAEILQNFSEKYG